MIKKILIAAAIALSLGGAAVASDCPNGTLNEKIENLLGSAGDDVTAKEVPDSQVEILITRKGPPPNAEEGVPMRFVRMDKPSVEMTILLIGQKECLINAIGPVPTFLIDNLLGVSNAGN